LTILKLCDSESIKVQARSHLYSEWSMHSNICLSQCDLKTSHPDGECEVYCVRQQLYITPPDTIQFREHYILFFYFV